MAPTVEKQLTKPSDRLTASESGLYEAWIRTDELGWTRSAVRGSEDGINQVVSVLRSNFEVDVLHPAPELRCGCPEIVGVGADEGEYCDDCHQLVRRVLHRKVER